MVILLQGGNACQSKRTWIIAPPVAAVLRIKLTFLKATLAAENALMSGPGWLKSALPAQVGVFSVCLLKIPPGARLLVPVRLPDIICLY